MRFLDRNGYIIEKPPLFDANEAEVSLVAAGDVMTPKQIEHMKIAHPSIMLLKLMFPDGTVLFSEMKVHPLYKFSGIDVKKSDIKVVGRVSDLPPDPNTYDKVI